MPDMKIGKEMAQRVADRLKMKCDLMFSHRDYCGTGLTWSNYTFIYGHVYDGYMQDPIKEFAKENEFVDWLAEQSDRTLDGHDEKDQFYRGNQRLTQARLFGFVSSKPTPRYEN